MKDEIKEILYNLKMYVDDKYLIEDAIENKGQVKALLDYITNLQEELKSANESITWWTNRYKALQNRNIELVLERDRLKENNNAMQKEMAMTWKKLDKARAKLQSMFDNGNEKTILDDLLELDRVLGDDKNVKD